jgi:hypothetical protein
MGGIPLSRVFTNESGGSPKTSAASLSSALKRLQRGKQMGGKERPEESLSKHAYTPSH